MSHSKWGPSQVGPQRRRFDARAAVAATMSRVADQLQRQQVERAAHHEAGHAFALWSQGQPIGEVSIDDTGHGQTARTGDGPAWTYDDLGVVLLAGAAGERLAFPDTDGCEEDEAILAAILADNPGAESGMQARCDMLIRDGQDAVKALAATLLSRGRISGADAAAILAEHTATRTQPPAVRSMTRTIGEPESRTTPGTVRLVRTGEQRAEIPGVVLHQHWVEYPEGRALATEGMLSSPEEIRAWNQMHKAEDRGDYATAAALQGRLVDMADARQRSQRAA